MATATGRVDKAPAPPPDPIHPIRAMTRLSTAPALGRTLRSQALWAIGLTALGHFALELAHGFLPVVYPLLQERLTLSYSQIGTVALASTSAVTLAQPLFGHLSDRWDARTVAAWSVAWLAGLIGLVGLVPSYPALLGLVVLAGLGSAAFHPAAASVASHAARASRRKGAAMSLFSVGGNLGAALSPLLMALALHRLGLAGTLGVIPLGLAVGGLLWLGFREGHGARQTGPTALDDARSQASLLALSLVVLAAAARSWFQIAFMTYLPTWLEAQGHPLLYGGQMLFAFSALVGGGSLVGGVLSDRVGRWPVMWVSLGLLAPTYGLFLAARGPAQMVLAGLMGLLVGGTFPVAVVMAQEVWPRGAGFAAGVVMGLGWWPGGLGSWLTGTLADRMGLDTALAFLLLPPLVGAAAMGVFGLRVRPRRQTNT